MPQQNSDVKMCSNSYNMYTSILGSNFTLSKILLTLDNSALSEAECAATIIDCDLSKRTYMKIKRRVNFKRQQKIFKPHLKVQQYRDQKCTPKNVDSSSSETSIKVSLQGALNHQASKLCTPETVKKMERLEREKGAKFRLYFDYGKQIYLLNY